MLLQRSALRHGTSKCASICLTSDVASCSRCSTHYLASSSLPTNPSLSQPWSYQGVKVASKQRCRLQVATRALFDPPPFQPEKLYIDFLPGTSKTAVGPLGSRRYTLTHNDITGELQLSVGIEYNMQQISGFYTRLLRDEIIAEWRCVGAAHALHVFCHVSGEERWLAPPLLRNYIFRRELPLVLDCIIYADRQLLENQPHLAEAEVIVHFQSSVENLNSIEIWGKLGQRSTWQPVPTSMLKRFLYAVVGKSLETAADKAGQRLLPGTASSMQQEAAGSSLSLAATDCIHGSAGPSVQADHGDSMIGTPSSGAAAAISALPQVVAAVNVSDTDHDASSMQEAAAPFDDDLLTELRSVSSAASMVNGMHGQSDAEAQDMSDDELLSELLAVSNGAGQHTPAASAAAAGAGAGLHTKQDIFAFLPRSATASVAAASLPPAHPHIPAGGVSHYSFMHVPVEHSPWA